MAEMHEFYEMPASEKRLMMLFRELQDATNLLLARIKRLENLLYSIRQ